MAPLARDLSASWQRNDEVDCLTRTIASTTKWSCAADDGWSDYDALAKTMKLSRRRLVNLLLEKGSRVVKKQGKATSPLHNAVARMGWSSVIERLVALGARVSDKNSQGDTALHLAFVNNAEDHVLDRLLAKYLSETTTNVQNNDGLGFLHIASTRSSCGFVREFVERGVADIDCRVHLRSHSKYAGFTPLHFAVLFGRYEIAALLLRSGANVYARDRHGSTPIHLALYSGDQEMIDLLLAYDQRNENCINNFGLTHFMAACASSMTHIVEGFLYQRPNASILVNSRVRDVQDHPCAGYSPIHFAAEFGNLNTVQVLLDYGASCFANTSDNWTPIALARYSGREDIMLLLQRYCNHEDELFLVRSMNGLRSFDYAWAKL